MVKGKHQKRSMSILLCAVMVISIAIPMKAATPSKFLQDSDRAYEWLKYQQESAIFETTGQPTGLVDSFQDYWAPNTPKTEVYTYDQAVAAIAFLMKGDIKRASDVLSIMADLQGPDGSWVNSYWYNNLYGGELRKHVGPVTWMALAVMNYEKITGDTTTYREMAIKALDWSITFKQPNGALSGGQTMWDVPNTWTNEVWSSTEQNQDAYAALRYFAAVESAKTSQYNNVADGIKSFLDNIVWDSANNRWFGGFKNNTQLVDSNIPMDVNPWGVMALGLTGTRNYSASIDYVENAAGNPTTGQGTYEHPRYVHTLTDESTGTPITLYDFDWESDHSVADPAWGGGYHDADLWFEGSAFMACAYYMRGEIEKGDSIVTEIIKKQATNDQYINGGIPYSLMGTQNNYWKMTQENCISSTGWFIIAAARWNPFTGTSIDGDTTVQDTAATPAFSVAGGTYTKAQQVAINTTTGGATIRYTTNGTTPTESSPVYTMPINVISTTTIKAIAFKAGMIKSATASATYTIEQGTTPVLVAAINLNKSTSNIGVNANETLVATITPSNATNKNVNWTSSNSAVASVDSEGKVIGISAGTVTITATTAQGNKTASCIVTVTQTPSEGTIGQFNASLNYNAATLTVTLMPVTPSATANNLWYTDIAAPAALSQAKAGYSTGAKNSEGNYIVTIPNASIGTGGLVNLYLSTNTGDTGWVAFNVDGGTNPTPETVATPIFSIVSGTYTSAQQVAISSATSGATLRYTTNGTTPTETSEVYNGAINVSLTSTIKAIAYKLGMTASTVATAAYTIEIPIPQNTIGQFNAQFVLNGTDLTVTLTPTVSSATAMNLWYTDIAAPTALSQAKAGYSTGAKNSAGNYIVVIPNAAIGTNGQINLYLSTNTGDTGWAACIIN